MNITLNKIEERIVEDLREEYGLNTKEALNFYFNSVSLSKKGFTKILDDWIIDEVAAIIDLQDGHKRLGAVLYALYEAYRNGTWVFLSRNRNDYTKDRHFLSYDFLIRKIVDPLIVAGCLDQRAGINPKSNAAKIGYLSYKTRIRAKGRLLALFEEYTCSHDGLDDLRSFQIPSDLVIVRKDNKNKSPIKIAPSNRAYQRMCRNVGRVNEAIRNTEITIDDEGKELLEFELLSCDFIGDCLDWKKHEETLNYLYSLRRAFCLDTNPNIADHFFYRRIFNYRGGGYFDFGGRWYAQGSNMPSNSMPLRDHILFDGNRTVELDYSSMHPRMMAAEQGYRDIPEVYGVLEPFHSERSVRKKIMNALINCKTEQQAWQHLQKLKNDGVIHASPETILETIESEVTFLKDYIGTNAGLRLQRIDSDIAEQVMIDFIDLTGDAILCFHDSFRVEEKNKGLLGQIMKETWQDRFPNTKVKISEK